MSFLITISQKELHRLELIQKIRDERLSVVQAADRLDLSRSQVHRLLQAYDLEGPARLASIARQARHASKAMTTIQACHLTPGIFSSKLSIRLPAPRTAAPNGLLRNGMDASAASPKNSRSHFEKYLRTTSKSDFKSGCSSTVRASGVRLR
ncbi:helix-turn-helix domain-containing protein [Rhizobium sp. YK2]|uniref:helix-turn-helix domain-containing protein n=1 Tax=Rhizobium sp. YK2 TaxID=1860096 RepID=UPI00247820B9|nr:helix-turn-helix domain-containing protein [Rhizobium sp. YK2]